MALSRALQGLLLAVILAQSTTSLARLLKSASSLNSLSSSSNASPPVDTDNMQPYSDAENMPDSAANTPDSADNTPDEPAASTPQAADGANAGRLIGASLDAPNNASDSTTSTEINRRVKEFVKAMDRYFRRTVHCVEGWASVGFFITIKKVTDGNWTPVDNTYKSEYSASGIDTGLGNIIEAFNSSDWPQKICDGIKMSRSDGGGSSEKDDLATVEGNIALGLQMYSYWRSEGKHFLGNQRAAESLVDQAANDCASKKLPEDDMTNWAECIRNQIDAAAKKDSPNAPSAVYHVVAIAQNLADTMAVSAEKDFGLIVRKFTKGSKPITVVALMR